MIRPSPSLLVQPSEASLGLLFLQSQRQLAVDVYI